jgi:uncharacterized delta-60 repeat protein
MNGPGFLALALFLSFMAGHSGFAQSPGTVDLSFEPGWGPTDGIDVILAQPDGKLLVGSVATGVARLHPDGTLDHQFNPEAGAYRVRALALQPDGKVLIGGEFPLAGGAEFKGAARLNPDGSLDESFTPATFPRGVHRYAINALALQSDGRILVGGVFTSVNGVGRLGLARLEPDGRVDTSFDARRIALPGPPAEWLGVASILLQPDQKILIGGDFPGGIGRLQQDGAVDPDFFVPSEPPGFAGAFRVVHSLVLQPDGKVILGISVTDNNFFPPQVRHRVARHHPDGAEDHTFIAATTNGRVRSLALRPDGKLLIGGEFTSVNGQVRNRVGQLAGDGSLDGGFDPGTGPGYPPSWGTGSVLSIVPLEDGRVLIGGTFITVDGAFRDGIARLNRDGRFDPGFDATGVGIEGLVRAILVQPDGGLLIGLSQRVQREDRNGIARLHPDGTLDGAFDPGAGADASVLSIVEQPDGKLLIGGEFSTFDRIPRTRIARLNLDGSLDLDFNPILFTDAPPVWPSGEVTRLDILLAPQPDGRLVIVGEFITVNGIVRPKVARLNPDGTLDESFNAGTGPEYLGPYSGRPVRIDALILQADGKILIGGRFSHFNTLPRDGLARLNPDGSLDPAFDPRIGGASVGQIQTIVLQPDHKIVIGGVFPTVEGVNRAGMARLNPDGTLDPSFERSLLAPLQARMAHPVLQPDGKFIVAGEFPSQLGTTYTVSRLNPDGTLDDTFDAGIGANHQIFALALQPDRKLLIGGQFTGFQGYRQSRLVRLHTGPAFGLRHPVTLPDGRFRFTLFGAPGNSYTIQTSPDLAAWSDLKSVTLTATTLIIDDENAPAVPRRFYRVHPD